MVGREGGGPSQRNEEVGHVGNRIGISGKDAAALVFQVGLPSSPRNVFVTTSGLALRKLEITFYVGQVGSSWGGNGLEQRVDTIPNIRASGCFRVCRPG